MRASARRARPLAVLPVLALVAVAATACAPSHAGAAATVGSSRITVDQLRSTTQQVLAAQPAGGTSNVAQGAVQRTVLGQLVSLDVLQHLATQYGVSVTPTQVGTARTQIAASVAGTNGAAATSAQATAALAAQGADLQQEAQVEATYQALIERGPVTDGQVTAAFDAQTDHDVYAVAAFILPSSLQPSQLVTALQSATASQLPTLESEVQQAGGTVQTPSVDGATLDAVLGQRAGTVYKANEIAGPETLQSGESIVIEVTAVSQRTLAQALAPDSVERATAFDTGYYSPAEKSLGVHVNPRFGGWTPSGTDVESLPLGSVGAPPAASELSSPVSSAPASSSSASPAASASG